MFLYQANRLETLAAQLCKLLETDPPSPLSEEIVVVQHQGMAQWLNLQIARALGIAANIRFPLPARFLGETAGLFTENLDGADQFDRAVLLWNIFQTLPEAAQLPSCGRLSTYLDDLYPEKRYQLAKSISEVFDQYLVYRPDVIQRWENGEEDHWQAVLWRLLLDRIRDNSHRGRQALETIRVLAGSAPPPKGLPRRCFLFGINSLAPVYLEILSRLNRFMEVHFLHITPCAEYWGDLQSDRSRALSRKKKRTGPAVMEELFAAEGNRLLGSWGTVGQDFHNQLLDFELFGHELYTEAEETSLLGCLQNNILNNTDKRGVAFNPSDHSISFHVCHSPLREVQVLHDRLLEMFERIPDLSAGDILVTAPDINQYADAVHTVFNATSAERHIPYFIADQSMERESTMTNAFLDLLALFSGRFSAPEVLDLLETESILKRFSIPLASVPQLRQWVDETSIRWGLNGDQEFDDHVCACREYSWQAGLDRLLLGYFCHDPSRPFASVYPHPIASSSDAELLGMFAGLIRRLGNWLPVMNKHHTGEGWARLLLDLLKDFFDREIDESGYELLADVICTFGEQADSGGLKEPLGLKVVSLHLREQLSGSPARVFLTGRTTFCNMVPMRAVPFQVICILGMTDNAFPRSQQPPSFDLIARAPRIGDRNRRKDDRYLFLELVTSARDVLYISWPGRNQRDDAFTPPSTVVCELQDYLDELYPGDTQPPSILLTTHYPLQPFSPAAFSLDNPARSFAEQWVPAAGSGQETSFYAPREGAKTDLPRIVDPAELSTFWKNPVSYFLTRCLGMKIYDTVITLEASEPFALDSLQMYGLRQQTVRALLEEQSRQPLERVRSTSALPHGLFGDILLEELTESHQIFVRRIRELSQTPVEPLPIDLDLGNIWCRGILRDLYQTGRVTWRASGVRGPLLMELWIQHLLLNLAAPKHLERSTTHITRDQILTLEPVSDPEPYLAELADLYLSGLASPLPFFPESCRAWNRAKAENRLRDAARAWLGSNWSRGEREQEAYLLLYRQPSIGQLDEQFRQLADLFTPLYDHLSIHHEAA